MSEQVLQNFFTTHKISNLTDDQNLAYQSFIQGKNILITGQAGTGKSHLVKKIVSFCERNQKNVAVTAMTGAAACLINGKTIHSWACVGVGDKSASYYADMIIKAWPKKSKWIKCRVLIIDEVSMMNAHFFELLEEVARIVKNNSLPFGGIQLILLGDFYQLPPVAKGLEDNRFCFESERWEEVMYDKIVLTEIMRQKNMEFQKVLGEVRLGQMSDETIKTIQSRIGIEPDTSSGIKPTVLYSTRTAVDRLNKFEFNKLPSEDVMEYETTYEIVGDRKTPMKPIEMDKWISIVDKENNYEKTLQLTEGAQVMLLKNLDQEKGLINGSRGVIVGFDEGDLPMVKFLNGEIETIGYHDYSYEISHVSEIIAKQIPLALAWCTTIHKSQGQSLDYVKINIGKNIFEYGQSYVALSRARTLDGLFVEAFDPKKVKVHPKVVDFFEK